MSKHIYLLRSCVISMLLVLFVCAACGTSAGASSPKPKPPTSAIQKCGTIGVRPGGRGVVNSANDANRAGNCFWQAYQQCQAASLVVSFGGIDTITTHTFSVQQKQTGCTLQDAVRHRVIPQSAKDAGTFACSALARTDRELRFSNCGMSGNIVVPIMA